MNTRYSHWLGRFGRSSLRLSLFVAPAALLLAGCGWNLIVGAGQVASETREVSGFDAVQLTGSGDLIITQGDEEALTIEAEDNILPYLSSTVQGGTLVLGADTNWTTIVRPTRPVRYLLAVQELRAIDVSGSGTVQAGSLTAEQLAVTVSGSSDVIIEQLAAAGLTYTVSGSGNANMAGEVTAQQVEISGSGDYQAGDLASQTAEVRISGAGSATLWVQESLEADISGSGTVRYYGSPAVSSQVSGSGDVEGLGEK
jgi:hypothetical protein